MKTKILLFLLLLPAIVFCNNHFLYSKDTSNKNVIAYHYLNINNIMQNDVLSVKLDSLTKELKNDTIGYSLQKFLSKEIVLYKENKLREAKARLIWPIIGLFSFIALILAGRRKERTLQLIAGLLFLTSIILMWIHLKDIFILLDDNISILYLIL
jgi:hypothetical protein